MLLTLLETNIWATITKKSDIGSNILYWILNTKHGRVTSYNKCSKKSLTNIALFLADTFSIL